MAGIGGSLFECRDEGAAECGVKGVSLLGTIEN